MLSTLAASAIPLRVPELIAVMAEREKQEILSAYLGDIQCSILRVLLAFGGKKDAKFPSYSDMVDQIRHGVKKKKQLVKVDRESFQNMVVHDVIQQFLPEA